VEEEKAEKGMRDTGGATFPLRARRRRPHTRHRPVLATARHAAGSDSRRANRELRERGHRHGRSALFSLSLGGCGTAQADSRRRSKHSAGRYKTHLGKVER
jgi:hypothetical protein